MHRTTASHRTREGSENWPPLVRSLRDPAAGQGKLWGSSGEALGKAQTERLFERCSGDRRSYRNKKPADNSLSAGVATQGQMISNRIARSDRRRDPLLILSPRRRLFKRLLERRGIDVPGGLVGGFERTS